MMGAIQTGSYTRFWSFFPKKAKSRPIAATVEQPAQSAYLQEISRDYLEKAAIANLGPVTKNDNFKVLMKRAHYWAQQNEKLSRQQTVTDGDLAAKTITRIIHPKLVGYISLGWNKPPYLISNEAQWEAFKQLQADWHLIHPVSKTRVDWGSISHKADKTEAPFFCPPNIFVIDGDAPLPDTAKAEES